MSPGRIRLLVVMLLTVSRSGSATPTLAAIPARKSPGLTTYWVVVVAVEAFGPAADVVPSMVRVLSEMAEREAATNAR